jgi:U3 small nucleolar RNA-associated protein 10
VLAFWASLTTQAVDGMISASLVGRDAVARQKREDLLLRVVPVLNEALSPRMADVSELVVGACTVIMVLGAKGRLEDHVLDTLMEAVVVKPTPATVEAKVTCLAVLAEQREAVELAKNVNKKLARSEVLVAQLLACADQIAVGRLVLGLILRDLKARSKSEGYLSVENLSKVLRANALTEAQERSLCERMVELMSNEDKPISEAQRQALSAIVEYLSETSSAQTRFEDVLSKANVEQSIVEAALQTTFLLTNGSTTQDVDGDDEMADAPTETDAFATTVAKLEAHKLSEQPFLSLDAAPEDYALFKAAYAQALTSDARLEQFLQVSTRNPEDSVLSVPAVTLLLSLSDDASLPAKARAIAWRCLQRLVKSEKEPSTGLQFLVSYLIAALADKSSAIRQMAAEIVVSIAEVYRGEHKDKAEVDFKRETYAWESLSHEEMRYLLDTVLVPNLEEAVLDANSIIPSISTILGEVPKETKKLKKTKSTTTAAAQVCVFLAEHAAGTTLASTKVPLLATVNKSGTIGSIARENTLVSALKQTLTSLPLVNLDGLGATPRLELEAEFWRCVDGIGRNGLELLQGLIAAEVPNVSTNMVRAGFKRVLEVWDALDEEKRTRLADRLVAAALRNLDTEDKELYHTCGQETIRSVKLRGNVLTHLVSGLPNALNMPDTPPATKRRRTSRSEKARISAVAPSDLTATLAKYTLILELVDSNNAASYPELLHSLFKVLEQLQNFRLQTQTGLTYLQNLTMSSLLAIVDALKAQKDAKPDLSAIRTDLIVDCIRHSSNAQVQSTALLLVSSLASWQPETVVNSIMPIFTFMGHTLLRQADSYSAHVTEQTISRVVPPLVESFRKKNKDVVIGASSLLLSFTAAFEHIPLHRRLGLFEHLARTVGAEECLYALVAMLTDAYPTDRRAKRFVAELLARFEPAIALRTVKKMLDLVWDMYRSRRTTSNSMLNMSERPKETHDNIAANLLGSTAALLGDRELKEKISKSFESGDIDQMNAQRTVCVELIQEGIRLGAFVKTKPDLVAPAGAVLKAIVGLLPTVELVQCATTLLGQKDEEVRIVAVDSVLNRAKEIVSPSNDDVASLLDFTKELMQLLGMEGVGLAIKVQAIDCVGQIVKKFGRKDTSLVISAAQVIADKNALKHEDRQVQLASVVCLTLILRTLKDEFIPLMPLVVPTVFSYLLRTLGPDSEQNQGPKALSLSIACFAFLHAVVEHLPFLVAPDSLETLLMLLAKAADVDKLADSRSGLYRLLAKNVPVDKAFAAFEGSFETVAAEGSLQVCVIVGHRLIRRPANKNQAILEIFSAIRLAITTHPKSAIIRNAHALFELFLKALDQPRIVQTAESDEIDFDDAELERLQFIYHEVALVMIMKLNDATLRPFIVRLSEWVGQLPKKDAEGRTLRATALFNFLASLFAKLKGLVTSYTTYFLEQAVDVLTNTTLEGEDRVDLLRAVLAALTESFDHDDESFWQSPHHFKPISTPLINLLSTTAMNLASELLPKVHTALLTLAASTSSHDQHKSLNDALLKLLRHEDARVRLAAVKLERELCEKLGDEWVGMLPEMLPFVAEVLEDEEREVERAGREWVRYLEGVLGENLDLS